MKFKGKELILDNFRSVLKGYSVDIQDVVRSAILDGVDISKYIGNVDPYKLDQIRLAMKEGYSEAYFSLDGSLLYKIRQLKESGVSLSSLESILSGSNVSLSEEHMKYLVSWISDGVSFSKLNIKVIPKKYLSVFDKGLRLGLDMSKFIGLKHDYSVRYLELCLQIEKMGKSCQFLLQDEFNVDVVEYLHYVSDMSDAKWKMVEESVTSKDSLERVSLLISLIKNGINVSSFQDRNLSNECLSIIQEAYRDKLDLSKICECSTKEEMTTLYNEMKLKKNKKVSGRIVKR